MATSILYTASPGGRLETLTLDATLSRESAQSVDVTKHPIEDGSVVSDHAIRAPDLFRLTGVITSTPAVARARLEAEAEAGSGPLAARASEGRARLEGILARRDTVTISAGGKSYENMVMTDLRFPEDAQTGDALNFAAGFEQIVAVSSETVSLPKTPAASSKVSGGHKPTTPATEPVKKRVSVARQILDAFTGKAK